MMVCAEVVAQLCEGESGGVIEWKVNKVARGER